MVKQLEKMEHDEAYRCVPLTGEALVARVQIQMQGGLVELNRLIKQATLRRHIVVQLIRMWRDAGHPDYRHAFQGEAFYRRLQSLSPTDEAAVRKPRKTHAVLRFANWATGGGIWSY